jgi:hypothetical protein
MRDASKRLHFQIHLEYQIMKNIINRITAAAVLAIAGAGAIPAANATDVGLYGTGYYDLGSAINFRNNPPYQSGRYKSLGSDYYHSAEIGIEILKNHSAKKSGDLSFELWAMRYYKANTGIVLMTRGVKPLAANTNYYDVSRLGKAIFLDRRRFPELDLWEFTNDGWKFRDALSFPYRDHL